MMHNARRWILQGKGLHLAGLVAGPQVREQKRVVARLDANDVMHAGLTQVAEVGALALRASSTMMTGRWGCSWRNRLSQRRVAFRSQSFLV